MVREEQRRVEPADGDPAHRRRDEHDVRHANREFPRDRTFDDHGLGDLPGATPEEVEESICLKIEEAVQSVEDVKEITATANENMGVVSIEILDGADIGSVMDDVKVEIDAIDTFPVDAEEPIITQQKVEERVLALAVSDRSPPARFDCSPIGCAMNF